MRKKVHYNGAQLALDLFPTTGPALAPPAPAKPAPVAVAYAPQPAPVVQPGPVTFVTPDYLPDYLNFMRTRGLTRRHIIHVEQHCRDCQATTGKLLAELGKFDLMRYDAELAKREQVGRLAPATVNKYQDAINGFYKWAVERAEVLTHNPCPAAFVRRKVPKRLPRSLTSAEFAQLMTAAGRTRFPIRDQALIAMLGYCGLRINEALGLTWERIADGFVTVIGKGDKERKVPVPAALLPYLEAWREKHPHGGTGPVFTNGRAPYAPLRYDSNWRKYIPRLVKRAGLSKKATSHWLRHSYAQALHDAEMPLDEIQQLLGHSQISTTQVYARASITKKTVAGINATFGGAA